ncbi:hypothetical protein [Desulfosarcina cetonica]|uniref:hypothetical protein n=1 Tax=Desulfosarcina cetonica TaxID=90730 RepID=UPI0006CF5CBE|nr:hypothetical protein [Desulfosarcina cetonica]
MLAEDMHAKVNSPSIDASMKDGYAVRSVDIALATPENPVILKVVGMAAAGTPCAQAVTGGTAVRILTGARVPMAPMPSWPKSSPLARGIP